MEQWIIDELWRRDRQEREDQEREREVVHIDAPDTPPEVAPVRDEEEEAPKRGVLIIEL